MSIFDIFKKNDLKSAINALKRNEIVINQTNKKTLRSDESKIGGKPLLPADFVWPTFTSKDDNVNRPLMFLCRINLSDIAAFDKEELLPKSGMLYFFYDYASFCWGFDPEDKGAARVYYFESTEGFSLQDFPDDLDEEYRIPEMSVSFSSQASYVGTEEFPVHSDMDFDWDDYYTALKKLGVDIDTEPQSHKMLGYADVIQNEMLSECERVTRGLYSGDADSYKNTPEDEALDILEKAKDWILLLQLSTIKNDDFELMFGDVGKLYFYIKKQDLIAKNFDNIWFSLQCG